MTDDNTKKPSLSIFARRRSANGETALGSQIGVGFAHNSGGGFNILLDASPIPIDGRIELVAFPNKGKSDQV